MRTPREGVHAAAIQDQLLEKTIAFERSPAFQAAKVKVPNYEVEDTLRLLSHGPVTDPSDLPSEDEVRAMRVTLRYQNPICGNPACLQPQQAKRRVHGGKGIHRWCSCCRLVAYCDRECQKADYQRHKLWAASLPHSPRPSIQDPQAPIVAKMDESHCIVARLSVNANGDIVETPM